MFSFIDLFDEEKQCLCSSAHRLRNFCDSLTLNETSSFAKSSIHVCTMDSYIVQHKGLREALSQGLNHIPVRPTNIAEATTIMMDAFE